MALSNSSPHFASSLDLLYLLLKKVIIVPLVTRPLSGPLVFPHPPPREKHSAVREQPTHHFFRDTFHPSLDKAWLLRYIYT